MIARLLRWIAARRRNSYRRWLRRRVPFIPAKNTGRYHHDGHPKTEWKIRQEAARMGGNTPWSDGTDASACAANERLFKGTTGAPSAWRGKDRK